MSSDAGRGGRPGGAGAAPAAPAPAPSAADDAAGGGDAPPVSRAESEKSIRYAKGKRVSAHMDRDVVMLGMHTPTREATRTLQVQGKDDIIVTDAAGGAVGIVTDQDILSKVGDASVNAEATTLRDIMTTPLVTIGQGSTLGEALGSMRDNRIRKLPVVDRRGRVVGIIVQATIAKVIRDAAATQPRLLSPPVKAILGNLGFVLQFAGVLLLVPAIVATLLGDTVSATGIYLTTVLLLVTGFFLNSYGEKAPIDNMQQSSILVFLSLFTLVLFGTVPYLYVSQAPSETPVEAFANGFFSSAAGFTTGGVSLFDEPEELPQAFTFYRSFTQLVGGMSFVYLLITAFYPERKLESMRGFIAGKTLRMKELFGTITVIFTVYVVIIAVLLYMVGEPDILDNVSLSMSTIATGGFVPSSTIVQDMAWQGHVVLIAGMILGALPFVFHYGFVRKRFMSAKLGREVVVFFAMLGIAMVVFTWSTGLEPLQGAFHTVSAGTTTGMPLEGLSSLAGHAQAVLILLMFVGGCGYSTAGGIKVFRFLQMRRAARMLSRGGRASLTPVERKEIATMGVLLVMFPLIAAAMAAHLSSASGAPLDEAFLEAAGLITTGGLSPHVITLDTDPATKIVSSFLMIFGRLEIVAILYIFVPRMAPA